MRLNEIRLGTENLEDSVNFYTQTLGLKKIERKSNVVALQGRDINGCVVLEAEIYEKYRHISFTVDNLDNIVQKLKNADVEVENYNDGNATANFKSPENVIIELTTADPPDMSGGEETEIRIDGLALKTDNVEDSVQFYTQVLGLKEIEGLSYKDNEDYVGLQAGDIVIELLSTGWFESEGFEHIDFTVDNLDNTVQKLKDADVDVELQKDDETGETLASLYDPDEEVQIILSSLAENAETPTPNSDGNTDRPSIGEKVRFWEEQDKINQALIPRVMEMHEVVTDLHKRTANISDQIAAAEARVLQQMQQQVSGMVNDLMPDIEKRLIQLVKEEIKSQIDQNLSGIRRIAYVALVLATLAFAITLYQWVA